MKTKTIIQYKKQGNGTDSWIVRHCEVEKNDSPVLDNAISDKRKKPVLVHRDVIAPFIVYTEPTQEEAEKMVRERLNNF